MRWFPHWRWLLLYKVFYFSHTTALCQLLQFLIYYCTSHAFSLFIVTFNGLKYLQTKTNSFISSCYKSSFANLVVSLFFSSWRGKKTQTHSSSCSKLINAFWLNRLENSMALWYKFYRISATQGLTATSNQMQVRNRDLRNPSVVPTVRKHCSIGFGLFFMVLSVCVFQQAPS